MVEIDRYLEGPPEEALGLQRPAPEAVMMLPPETKAT
jgi:hypothetical protein